MFPPEFYIRFAAMIILSLAFGLTGLVFVLAYLPDEAISNSSASIGMAICSGIALVILIVIGLSLLDIPTTLVNLLLALSVFYIISFYKLGRKLSRAGSKPDRWPFRRITGEAVPVIILIIVLAVRAAQINDAFVPNWLDGLVHASLLNKYIANAGLPLDSIYHIGFHAIALSVYFVGGLSLPETILVLGQWLSAVSGLSLYYLALRFTHNTYVAGLSFIAYSLFLMFPAFLTSWGRFPFLLGLTLLPFAILTSLDWMTSRAGSYWITALFIIALGLSHYGSLIIWVAFILAYWMGKFIFEKTGSMNGYAYGRDLARLALIIVPLVLIGLPKVINLFGHPAVIDNMIARAQEPGLGIQTSSLLEEVHSHDYFFVFIWILSVPWFLVRKTRLIHITVFWPLLVGGLTWAQFEIVDFSISTYTNLIVFLAMPMSLSFGFFVQELLLCLKYVNSHYSLHLSRNFFKGLLAISLLVGLLWGLYATPRSLDRKEMVFTGDDWQAMKWINENTAKSSGFLIRTMISNNNRLIPSDGGGWIEYLTGRKLKIPEIGELYDVCEYSKLTGANYIYLGKQSNFEDFDFRLEEMSSSDYEISYQNQSVRIIHLNCP